MQKFFLFLFLITFSNFAYAGGNCFVTEENEKILFSEGDCKTRHSPCSTFKIAISLMGYDRNILIDETHPVFPFKEGYTDKISSWKQPHNPTQWMQDSCVWFSQVLTQKLGGLTFKEYVKRFKYGNMDTSGDPGKKNGLTNSWLSSSLKISPLEQIRFLENFVKGSLPVSNKSVEMTKRIIYLDELNDGWKLYGKTGTGKNPYNEKLQIGWFVGWIEKEDRKIFFANFIEDQIEQDTYAGPRAKEEGKDKLIRLLAH